MTKNNVFYLFSDDIPDAQAVTDIGLISDCIFSLSEYCSRIVSGLLCLKKFIFKVLRREVLNFR